MSSTWTLSTSPAAGGTVSAVMGAPEWGDTHEDERRQARAISDGGRVFVQDLEVEDHLINLVWHSATIEQWSALRKVLRAAEWQVRRIQIDVTGDQAFPVGISPGQSIAGVGLSPGQGFSPGDTVKATTFTLQVRLDQPSASVSQPVEGRVSVALRFRKA